ncbi:transducin family protein/WD-40 repeat family protein [Lactarius deliciosus]|nr:transducin family protein/WD-40 repeat family protein [Lactarius deliciosus]
MPIDIANIQLEDTCTELERANAVAHAMGQRDDDSEVDDIKVNYDDEDSTWVDEGDEAMDDDTTKDFVSPKRNGDLSKYNLDTYDKEDDGPASSSSDNMLVTAIVKQNVPQLHFFGPHHDLLLSSMPLCLEWLDYPVSSANKEESMDTKDGPDSRFGNYVAIGTLEPEIEIYSIDLLDSVARPRGRGHGQEEKAKHRSASEAHHVDTILSLSWNRTVRQMLASGSADCTVKLWDLSRDPKECALRSSGKLHMDKVQAVGSYDCTVWVFNSRAPDASVGAVVGADVEAICWDPWDNYSFYVLLENGMVVNFNTHTLSLDLDQPSPACFTIAAHDATACALDVNAHIHGCLEHEDGTKRQVSLVAGRDLGLGEVFSAVWFLDDPLALAAVGSKAKLQIWDVSANFGAHKVFGPRLAEVGRKLRERTTRGVISVADDEEDMMKKSNSLSPLAALHVDIAQGHGEGAHVVFDERRVQRLVLVAFHNMGDDGFRERDEVPFGTGRRFQDVVEIHIGRGACAHM